uniref:Uncharacterized protein n=1 Tax=Arundo donax TaxID=35708 RepID=A0A0A8ZUV4_ARUDO
MRPWSAMGTR